MYFKEYSTGLVLHSYNIVTLMMGSKKRIIILAEKLEIALFFIPCILLPCQNLVLTLPTMHPNHLTVQSRFRCVMSVAANVASGLKQR